MKVTFKRHWANHEPTTTANSRKEAIKEVMDAFLTTNTNESAESFIEDAEITEIELTYNDKKRIADNYLFNTYGLGWNDLADINSLHDAESREDIEDMCEERINDF